MLGLLGNYAVCLFRWMYEIGLFLHNFSSEYRRIRLAACLYCPASQPVKSMKFPFRILMRGLTPEIVLSSFPCFPDLFEV